MVVLFNVPVHHSLTGEKVDTVDGSTEDLLAWALWKLLIRITSA